MTVTVPDYLSLNCMMLYMRKLTHNFGNALFSWVSSPFERKQTFRAQMCPYSDLQGPYFVPPYPSYIFLTLSPTTVSCIYYISAPWPLSYAHQVHSNLQGFALAAPPIWSTTALNVSLASCFPSSRLLLKIPLPVLLP